MRNSHLSIQKEASGVTFKVYVQPRSSTNRIIGLHGDALKVKIKAPPVDGAANKMCIQYLATCLDVPKSSVEIKSGQSGRTKQVRVRLNAGGDLKKEIQQLTVLINSWIVCQKCLSRILSSLNLVLVLRSKQVSP